MHVYLIYWNLYIICLQVNKYTMWVKTVKGSGGAFSQRDAGGYMHVYLIYLYLYIICSQVNKYTMWVKLFTKRCRGLHAC
jgi:hypothetical protein